MMQLIAGRGHVDATDHLAVRLGRSVDIHDRQRVWFRARRIERRHESQGFSRGLHRHLGRRIKRLIGSPLRHFLSPFRYAHTGAVARGSRPRTFVENPEHTLSHSLALSVNAATVLTSIRVPSLRIIVHAPCDNLVALRRLLKISAGHPPRPDYSARGSANPLGRLEFS
jgi:hypothetical protein